MATLELLAYYFIFDDEDDDESPSLSLEDRRRRSKRIPRISLLEHRESAFKFMYHSGNDQALINCCAVDHKVFAELLDLFKPHFDSYTIDRKTRLIRKLKPAALLGKPGLKGRPRKIDAVGCLGLVLYWFRTRGSAARGISLGFGLTASNLYGWLRFGRRVLLYSIHKHPDAMVTQPTRADIRMYVEAVANAGYHLLAEERVWAAMDGLKLPLQQSTHWLKQSAFYNGWLSHTYVNSVFCFAPDGKIRCATINAPGSWHDSTQADYGVYDKLEKVYNLTGGKVVVDSAFGLQARNFLIKSAQQDPAVPGATEAEAKRAVELNRQATSMRQLSEHGMRMIQGQFPRLKDNFQFEEFGERKIVLHLMVLLYNFQASKVGINQILNTFMSKTEGFYSYSITEDANHVFRFR